jgi:hypothetical protein
LRRQFGRQRPRRREDLHMMRKRNHALGAQDGRPRVRSPRSSEAGHL